MDAVAQFVNESFLACDKNEYTIAVFLDLSKAFDTIDHKVVVKKLEDKGIRGLAIIGLNIIWVIENNMYDLTIRLRNEQ